MNRLEEHWDAIYRSRPPETLSWHLPHLEAMDLIRQESRNAAIIDIGGGASTLVDDLLEEGYVDLTVLDISDTALDLARRRLGDRASRVRWIHADVTRVGRLPGMFDLWHDRAVFHFLILDSERHAYARLLHQSLKPGGRAIVETFALDGPSTCSGLPVTRYDADHLKRALGEPLELRSSRYLTHVTPAGKTQAFLLGEFVRTPCG